MTHLGSLTLTESKFKNRKKMCNRGRRIHVERFNLNSAVHNSRPLNIDMVSWQGLNTFIFVVYDISTSKNQVHQEHQVHQNTHPIHVYKP